MNNALIVRNVSKTFDKFKLDNISFEVPGGSIVGVIGKNGCGKSTLLSVLMGMKESDSTDTGIVIDGVCLQTDEKAYKKKIAYVFSELPFMEKISAVSIGKYYGRYYDGFNQKKYDEAKITAKINHEIMQHMRYAELKEIMYYVQKKEIIKESGDE
ncbi:ATP-binding cassette domain-containing protein [Agathobacter rectalis]|uniref:Iron(3+)-hydroxamate import ATP-binding protein FhuC n=1 Tax=Agathobacter rectalis TaxID=39491 RepID=A0A173R0B8_9FIRM|nr:ATP-binding cassette domain-containing protein [Agathobacter rectalis]CUM71292.1 Iron(3+)-hydroxamate import ATP-binding protein FhuC [Agathobacter rectalis]